MTELMSIEQGLNGVVSMLPTMTPDKIRQISERMVEVDRANKTLGRRNTQHTNQLMTLNMMSASPYRRVRQCLAQIENRRMALEHSLFKIEENKIKMKEWAEAGDEMSLFKIRECEYDLSRHTIYREGSLKEIAIFQQAMEDIKKANNIPDDWDEKDAEKDEARHHIRQAFRQAYRDVCYTGRIGNGNAEYLEQHGIQLQVATRCVVKYIQDCEVMMNGGTNPNIRHFYEWLDEMVEIFKDEWKIVLEEIGLSTIIRDEFLYLEESNGNN